MSPDDLKANLFIAGMAKCGTHALHFMLNQHPAIAMSSVKEPCHFVNGEDIRSSWPNRAQYQDYKTYRSLFTTMPETLYLGEASMLYTKLPRLKGVPQRIYEYNPDARFIFSIRSPLERVVSGYFNNYSSKLEREDGLERILTNRRYVDESDYAMQIRPYLELFPSSQIKIIVAERMRQFPGQVVQDIVSWLGLPPLENLDLGTEPDRNVTGDRVGQPKPWVKQLRLRDLAAWKYASRNAPAPIKNLAIKLLFRNFVDKAAVPVDILEQELHPELIRIVEDIEALLGEPIPEWQNDLAKWRALAT
ncbi:MAG: sulfotransferase family protein [Alphaproteobacteria bacterium]